MAKFTGFLVQALLVALSFWLNVCHNTDTIRSGALDALAVPVSAAASEEKIPAARGSNFDAGRALNAPDAVNEEESEQSDAESSDSLQDAVMNSTNTVDLAREEDSKIDESLSPKGGKLVSIPSVEVDALRGSRGADDRIVGITKEELLETPSRTPKR